MTEETVRKIINLFGGLKAMTELTGILPSVICMWRTRGSIPAKRQMQLLSAAREHGIPLSPEDFFPTDKTHNKEDAYVGRTSKQQQEEAS